MVDIYKLKFTVLQQEIIRLFFVKAGTTLNARRISQYLGVSATAVSKALPELEKQSFIVSSQDKESKRWSIELNRDNPSIMQLKRADNLRLIYESGLYEFLNLEFAGGTIILFGSYSRGEDIYNSDIDIAVIGRKIKKVDTSSFDKILERKIIVNFYESFHKIHKDLKDNLMNGIVLAGGVDL